ncbi:NAD(P)/FAD-dependent oxidoreductase [Bermanella sp. WJH001]|uniref:NAD(P)/FAD-dependent oxidoreductase n=1 Tax=Bermanella sp. WJH001 TaxID=3048005 RepID=UPI0024BD7143|nr:NAD(P)/FAD-dependent oxidoreductase [Bermanella sp. WJH001]MDJ1538128.1 NAD(P)/FAD-dependent oxidoreductase [Bermanella sp. WJH001]
MPTNQVIIIGAGAAGLMCAISAAENGKTVLVLDHANKAGKKILISGGGRCNFTNMYTEPSNYLSANPHFCKSALKRYTQWDFIAEVDKAGLPWHEKKLGQLFSDNKSEAILNMLLDRCQQLGVSIELDTSIQTIEKQDDECFVLTSSAKHYQCRSLVIATGAMSFPTMGATDFGHRIARQFGLKVTNTTPGLVPFTFDAKEKARFDGLSGVSIDTEITCGKQSFRENILFTHKGLSGPAVLQISSYWQPGNNVTVRCLPDLDLYSDLKQQQSSSPNKHLINILKLHFPERVIEKFCAEHDLNKPLQQYKHNELELIADLFQKWTFIPSGTEGYKKAEVTLGGVDTDEISSKTFEAKKVKGLFFIGEVLDVTGHLGGFNFQWAWASGYCCGQAVI